MNNIRLCTNEFKKNLDDIVLYIDIIDKQKKLLERLSNMEELIHFNEIRDIYNEFNSAFRTPVAYNAIIISVYGCFEAFVDKSCSSYIDMMKQCVSNYEQLPEKLRNKHIRKTGEFLSNSQRFKNYGINEKDVVSNLLGCMTNEGRFGLNKELLLSHSGNLRIEQLVELLGEMGITDCKGKILANSHFIQRIAQKYEVDNKAAKDMINERNRRKDNSLFEELDALVEQRNRVAHGWVVDSRISTDMIKNDIISFIHILGEIVCEILEESFVSFLYSCGKLKEFSPPIIVHNNKILCVNSKDSFLKRGGYIFAIIEDNYKMLEIEEIQVDRKSIPEVSEENIDIGVKVNSPIKDNWNYYYIKRVGMEMDL